MNRDEFYSSLYLAHHGIKGQKWGVRRYQNEDGSYTDEGAKRRRSDNKPGMSDGAKKALKVGAVAAGTALAAIGAYKLYQMNKPVTAFTAFDLKKDYARIAAKEIPGKLKKTVDKASKEVKKTSLNALKNAGKAAASASLAAIGTITASKVAAQFKDKPGDDEQTRNANLIKREAMTAAARSVASSASARVGGNSNNNSKRSASGKEFTDMVHNIVGTPNRKHDWNGEYQTRYERLMNGPLRDNPTIKADVKTMRHLEYSIDQMEEYVKAKS